MITLDSNKIEAPASCLRHFKEDGLMRTLNTIDGEIMGDKFVFPFGGVGFNRFEYNKKKETILVETSAKILSDDYLQGIHINNIERVVHQVNAMAGGRFEIDPKIFIEEGKFLNIDTTNNLRVSHELRDYFEALLAYGSGSKYQVSRYTEKGNQGVVYKGQQRTFKERLIVYDKYIELTQKSDNREFFKTLNNSTRLLNEVKGVLRVEQNSVELRKIRERLNIHQTSILGVLTSPMKPNYNLAMKIIRGAEQLSIFNDLDEFKTFNQFEKFKGQETICRECGYDLENIEALMRHFFSQGTNFSRQRRYYRNLIYTLQDKDRIEKGGVPDLVEEVLQLLQAS